MNDPCEKCPKRFLMLEGLCQFISPERVNHVLTTWDRANGILFGIFGEDTETILCEGCCLVRYSGQESFFLRYPAGRFLGDTGPSKVDRKNLWKSK